MRHFSAKGRSAIEHALPSDQTLGEALESGHEQVLVRPEVVVHQAVVDLRLLGQPASADAGIPNIQKQPLGGVQQASLAVMTASVSGTSRDASRPAVHRRSRPRRLIRLPPNLFSRLTKGIQAGRSMPVNGWLRWWPSLDRHRSSAPPRRDPSLCVPRPAPWACDNSSALRRSRDPASVRLSEGRRSAGSPKAFNNSQPTFD